MRDLGLHVFLFFLAGTIIVAVSFVASIVRGPRKRSSGSTAVPGMSSMVEWPVRSPDSAVSVTTPEAGPSVASTSN